MKKFTSYFICFFISLLIISCSYSKNTLIFTGSVECDQYKVSNQIGGIIEKLYVQEGEFVKKGSILAKIDSQELELNRQKILHQLGISKNQLLKYKNGSRLEEIEKSKILVQKQESLIKSIYSDLEFKNLEMQRAKKLLDENAETYQNFEQKKLALDQTSSSLDVAKKEKDYLKKQVSLLENGERYEDINIAKNNFNINNDDLKILDFKISKSYILSPKDFTCENIYFKEGEYIQAFSNFSQMLDLNNLWLKIYIPEQFLDKIALNQILNLNKNDKVIAKGKIVYISSESEFTPKNVESRENKQEMVHSVKIKIINYSKNANLKPGMILDINLSK